MKVTMKSIADKVGVSVNTVSLALRGMPGVKDETRRRIMAVAEELGYIDQKTASEARNICLVSTTERLRDSYFYMSFYQTILAVVQEYGYNMLVYNNANIAPPLETLQQNFKVNSVSGIIALGDMEQELVAKVAACGIPAIVIGAKYPDLKIPAFIEDNLEGSRLAVEYLHERGYSRIGYIGPPVHSTAFIERYQGFIGAMFSYGLPIEPGHLLLDMDSETHYDSVLNDSVVMAQWLKAMDPLPQAFICANDNLALMATKALHSLGRSVPNDVALIGFDASSSGRMAIPTITSVDVCCELQARTSVKKLMEFIASGETECLRYVLPVELIEGDSVGMI